MTATARWTFTDGFEDTSWSAAPTDAIIGWLRANIEAPSGRVLTAHRRVVEALDRGQTPDPADCRTLEITITPVEDQ